MPGLLMLLLGAQTAATPPAPGRHGVVTPPSWSVKPSGADLERYYPADARRKRLEGLVTIRCRVQVDQTLSACRVLSESPAGVGFGEATVKVAEVFRMHPETVDGKADAAGEVDIPITWKLVVLAPATEGPRWMQKPSGADIARNYPHKARLDDVEGDTVMECLVRLDGTVSDCVITSETPAGAGFGAATLRVAKHFRMEPAKINGKPVEGARVVIPVSWRIAP
jgi:TonB family protein